jgi:hypothetical protein
MFDWTGAWADGWRILLLFEICFLFGDTRLEEGLCGCL